MGDLKLVERLQQYTLAPGASKVIRANIKVTEGKHSQVLTVSGCRFGADAHLHAGPPGSATPPCCTSLPQLTP